MFIVETNLAIKPWPTSDLPPATTSDTKYTFLQAEETQMVAQGTLLLDGIDILMQNMIAQASLREPMTRCHKNYQISHATTT
jgi:hypothetical protein